MPDADARILRLQQGAVAVVLLAGFVFQIAWLIPVAAVLPGLDAAFGAGGPTARCWHGLFAKRAGPAKTRVSAAAARDQSLLVFGALVVATLLDLAGVGLLAGGLAIIVAGVSAACATGLFCIGAELERRRRGGSGGQRRPRRDR